MKKSTIHQEVINDNDLKNKKFFSILKSQNNVEAILFLPIFLIIIAPLCEFILRYPNIYDYPDKYFPFITIFLYLSGISGIILIINKTIKNRQLVTSNIPMRFFSVAILWILVSTSINGITPAVIYGDPYRRENIYSFIAYFLFLYFCTSFISSQKVKEIFLCSFLVCSIVLSLRELVTYLLIPANAESWLLDHCFSIFENNNHYGYYLTISALFGSVLLRSDNKTVQYIAIVSFVLNSSMLIINNTLGAYLACMVGLIFSIIVFSICQKEFDKLGVIILVCFLAISILVDLKRKTLFYNFLSLFLDFKKIANNTPDAYSAGTNRWGLIVSTLRFITERPLFGHGLEGIGERLNIEAGSDRPHCEYLQYAVFFGIPTAVSYICGVFSVFLNGLKYKYELDIYTIAALVGAFGYLVSAAFGNTMYYTAPYVFILLGLGYYRKNINK